MQCHPLFVPLSYLCKGSLHVHVHTLEVVVVIVVSIIVIVVVIVIVDVVVDVHDGVDRDEDKGEEGEGVEAGLWRTAAGGAAWGRGEYSITSAARSSSTSLHPSPALPPAHFTLFQPGVVASRRQGTVEELQGRV